MCFMLSLPAELLPRLCSTPRSVAVLALTCRDIASMLRQYKPIFSVTKKHFVAAEFKSDYYTCGFHTNNGATVDGIHECAHPVLRMCRICCDTIWISAIKAAEPEWIVSGLNNIVAICHDSGHMYEFRCRDYRVYQFWQVATTSQFVCIKQLRESNSIIFADNFAYFTQKHGTINALIDPGTPIYKQAHDSFCPYSVSAVPVASVASPTPAHLAAAVISLCLVSRA